MLGRRADPIVAIASAPGKGAVGVVRVSGAGLAPLALALTGKALRPRHAHYGPLLDASGAAIDHGLALFFPAPHSYTGEDVLELQAHGGPVVLQLLLARCLEAGQPWRVRLAEPGEFTERAFLNDKLDLVQAEAVADLIDASTEAGARSAARSLGGAFSAEVDGVAERIVALRMLVEATLDFPEEEIDFLQQADAKGKLAGLCAAVAAALARARQGALLRDGLRVVLAGQPNVGKSSLLNALAGAELAIVTPIAGTTRDRVSETVQIEGVPIHLTDTAGLRPPGELADEVERIGVARSWESIRSADAIVFLHDLTRWPLADYQAAEAEIAASLEGVPPERLLHVYNKADALVPVSSERSGSARLGPGPGTEDHVLPGAGPGAALPPGGLCLSARTGTGLDDLRRALLERAGWQPAAEGTVIARERHVRALQATAAHLSLATAHANQADRALDLLAEELRLAHMSLEELTGRFSADDLLGEIFSRFCIGK